MTATRTTTGTQIVLIKNLGAGVWLCEVASKHGMYRTTVHEQDMEHQP